jgi:hypothetical protein
MNLTLQDRVADRAANDIDDFVLRDERPPELRSGGLTPFTRYARWTNRPHLDQASIRQEFLSIHPDGTIREMRDWLKEPFLEHARRRAEDLAAC